MVGTKILVVDDDPNICDILKTHFESEGCEVITANDGLEGVSVFKSASIIIKVSSVTYFITLNCFKIRAS